MRRSRFLFLGFAVVVGSMWVHVNLMGQTSAPAPGSPASTISTPVANPAVSPLNMSPVQTQRSTDAAPVKMDAGPQTESKSSEAVRDSRPPAVASQAIPKPTDFQLLVQQSTGTLLPIFGASTFGNVPSTFSPVDNVPVTPDYVIGPGDEILIEAWGQTSMRDRFIVDRMGEITLPGAGTAHVAGLPYAKLEGYIRAQLQRVYRNFDLTVNLGHLRSIQVFVLGDVARPGAFTVSSLSTLVNALFASGGPSSQGSLRHIRLTRANKEIVEFDLYDLLLHGDKSKDKVLLPGDIIFVPPVGPQVAVSGGVLRPAIYELNQESSVADIEALAGGLTVTAGQGSVRIERINAHRDRMVSDVSLGDQASTTVRSGDIFIFSSITDAFTNAVTLRGNVQNPGRYVWHPGMRVRDLIPDRSALVTREALATTNRLGISTTNDYQQGREAQLNVGATGTAGLHAGQKASAAATVENDTGPFASRNDVVLAGPDVNLNYAVIERTQKDDMKTVLLPFNLGKAVLEGDSANNLELLPGDIVTIFSKADIPVPQSQRTRFVRLEGEFVGAGLYSVLPGETLRDVARRAGGLTSEAYLYGSEFTRESTKRLQQQRLDEYIEDLQNQLSETVVKAASSSAGTQTIALSQSTIDRLKSMRATGRIVLNLKPETVSSVEMIPDLALEDGDRFIVPRQPATVGVAGAVYNPANFLFTPRATAERYLQMAGGPSRNADRKRTFIIRADGTVVSHQYHSAFSGSKFSSLKLFPGDTVVVPARVSTKDPYRVLLDIAQIVGQFGLGVAAINVLR